jgi:Uma2 family endonuclease
MPASVRRRWTLAEVQALNDANPLAAPRYELVDGELLVSPSPNAAHQDAVLELAVALRTYLLATGVGKVFVSPFDVRLEGESTVGPDLFVVPPDEAARLLTEMPARALLLAAEVISPSTARADRGAKRGLYQRHVPVYWIVDVDAELVERWVPGDDRPEILRDTVEWQPSGAAVAFVLDLPRYFAGIHGRS